MLLGEDKLDGAANKSYWLLEELSIPKLTPNKWEKLRKTLCREQRDLRGSLKKWAVG